MTSYDAEAPSVDTALPGDGPLPARDRGLPPPEPPVADAATAPAPELAPDAAPPDAPPPSDVLAQQLALYLPLDDGQGTEPRDDSGENQVVHLRDGDPGSVWVPGRFGTGLDLGGGDSGAYLVVDRSPSLVAVRTTMSVTLWVRLPAGAPDGTLLSRRESGTGGYLYILELSRGRARVRLNSNNGYRADLSTVGFLPTGAWVHLAMTFDGQAVQLFVNGTPAGMAEYRLALPPDVTPILIGAAERESPDGGVAGVVNRLTARIDEVALYDRALTTAEVSMASAGIRPTPR
jgi:hypothetical protein